MPRNMGAVWAYEEDRAGWDHEAERVRRDDAREIHSPRTLEGEPVCCGGVTKCVDSHVTDAGTVVQRWWCPACERTSTTEEVITSHPDDTPHLWDGTDTDPDDDEGYVPYDEDDEEVGYAA